ncbi:beta-cyanoalanine synthase 1 [Artemisia annua]|uniref:Beta-cyanoalanine synthase 1 n=1 Tax=Artemisia annua TaxID=35608 RepID=A0A2U1NAI5_ARTAN|nr:beta-cyanoalanine synthase 1 [Artemisia annua]
MPNAHVARDILEAAHVARAHVQKLANQISRFSVTAILYFDQDENGGLNLALQVVGMGLSAYAKRSIQKSGNQKYEDDEIHWVIAVNKIATGGGKIVGAIDNGDNSTIGKHHRLLQDAHAHPLSYPQLNLSRLGSNSCGGSRTCNLEGKGVVQAIGVDSSILPTSPPGNKVVALKKGLITPVKAVLIEATSGNIRISMVFMAALKGYKTVLTMASYTSL